MHSNDNEKCLVYVDGQSNSVLFERDLKPGESQFSVGRDVHAKAVAADGQAALLLRSLRADQRYRQTSIWDEKAQFSISFDYTDKAKVKVMFAAQCPSLPCTEWPAQVSSLKVFGNLNSENSDRLHEQFFAQIEARAELVEAQRRGDRQAEAAAMTRVGELEAAGSKAAARVAKTLVNAAAKATEGTKDSVLAEAHRIRNKQRVEERDSQPLNTLLDTEV